MSFSFLLLAHWVGDFGVQTSPMALRKSKSIKWLTFHVLAYTASILTFSFFLFSIEVALIFAGLNAILHFITDFFTSKWISKHINQPRKYYPILGFDQMIHTLTLYWTLDYIGEIVQLFS